MKYCFGVQSKNSVNKIIEFSLKNPSIDITFIPSRRQVEYNRGYVNNWTTKEFTEYVKSKNDKIKIERDHSGPGQGMHQDDGFDSLKEDCKYFDIIHIDPWKQYPNLNDGIQWTVKMIQYCYKLNTQITYEIGTEEAIRPFTPEELEEIVIELKTRLTSEQYNQIKYLVIQCGTRLCEGKNIGFYNEEKLTKMLQICNKYNLISKEHNGDWLDIENIKQKEKTGLQIINIAPELAIIETDVILKYVKENQSDFDRLYNLCFASNFWKKWVSKDFDINDKNSIIRYSCHYLYREEEFKEIKNKLVIVDIEIQNNIETRLLELYYK
jgi:fructose/tagatose bisphosphate aldolase